MVMKNLMLFFALIISLSCNANQLVNEFESPKPQKSAKYYLIRSNLNLTAGIVTGGLGTMFIVSANNKIRLSSTAYDIERTWLLKRANIQYKIAGFLFLTSFVCDVSSLIYLNKWRNQTTKDQEYLLLRILELEKHLEKLDNKLLLMDQSK
jgi:hypothetical protein